MNEEPFNIPKNYMKSMSNLPIVKMVLQSVMVLCRTTTPFKEPFKRQGKKGSHLVIQWQGRIPQTQWVNLTGNLEDTPY